MADTGAPWNIPYAEPSDLVRDWPALSEAVGTAVAAGLTAAGNAGIGSNVVQTVKTNTFSTASGSRVDITGMTATITPTNATSKVLVMLELAVGTQQGVVGAGLYLMRDSTDIAISDAGGGARTRGFATSVTGTNDTDIKSVVWLDSPGVATATVYKVQMRVDGDTAYINRSFNDQDVAINARAVSSLTLIEVAV